MFRSWRVQVISLGIANFSSFLSVVTIIRRLLVVVEVVTLYIIAFFLIEATANIDCGDILNEVYLLSY